MPCAAAGHSFEIRGWVYLSMVTEVLHSHHARLLVLPRPRRTTAEEYRSPEYYSLFLFYDYRSPPSLTSTIYDQDDLKASFTDCRIAQSGGVWRLAAGSTSSCSTARLESSKSALLGRSRDRGHSIFLSLRASTLVDVLGQSLVKEKRPMKYAFYLPCDLSGSTMVS